MSDHQRVAVMAPASLHVAWKPFTDSETVKDGMLAVLGEVETEEKVKKLISSTKKKNNDQKSRRSRNRCF